MDSIYTSIRLGYVGGPCGSGKTHAFIQLTAEMHERRAKIQSFVQLTAARHRHIGNCRNTLYVAPSKELLTQVERDLKVLGLAPHRIDSDTHDGQVIPEVTRWLRSTNHKNRILLITHAAFIGMTYFHGRKDWDIYIDEVPQCDTFYDYRLPRTWRLLTEHLEIVQELGKSLGLIRPKNPGGLRHFLDLPRDDGERVIREILAEASNPNKLLFVDLASWERMVELAKASTEHGDDHNRIYFLSMLSPKAFRGATVMGADVQQSLLWAWFKRLGVSWVENSNIHKRLRYQAYLEDLGRRLHVKHLLDEGQWSKKMRKHVEPELDNAVEEWAAGKRFLLVKNNDHNTRLTKLSGCQLLSSVCHGLNSYQGYTKLAFISALNRKNKHRGMLNELGISDTVQRASVVYSALHQCVMRTPLRNPNSTEDVDILVADRWMADALAEAIGGAWISDAAGIHPERFRVRKEATSCEGNAKKEEYIDSILRGFGVAKSTRVGPPPQPPSSYLTLTYNKLAPRSDGKGDYVTNIGTRSLTPLQLVSYLEDAHKSRRTSKAGDYLFQLTQFNPNVAVTSRYLQALNFFASYGLILDFDGGSMTPEEFIRIFWRDAGSYTKVAFIITNTFSSTPLVRKFRVVIPYKHPATSIEQCHAVFDSIVRRLEENGHPPHMSGLDVTSRSPVHQYYLPCTNAQYPDSAFFEVRGLRRTDEFERFAIDPTTLTPAPRDETRWMASPDDELSDGVERMLDEAEDLKAEIEGMVEGRRKPVYALVCKYRAAGWSYGEIEHHLMGWAPDVNVERHILGAIESREQWEDGGCNKSGPSRPTQTETPKASQPEDVEQFAGPWMPPIKDESDATGALGNDKKQEERMRLGKLRRKYGVFVGQHMDELWAASLQPPQVVMDVVLEDGSFAQLIDGL